jgi:uncharacterized protein (TIGR02186 family)
MADRPRAWWRRTVFAGAAALLPLVLGLGPAEAQRRPRPPQPAAPSSVGEPSPSPKITEAMPAAPSEPEVRESVQADVSTRSVAITSSFTGVEIVVFGAVDNSRQASAESGLYDIIIVLEGTPTRLVARRKSNVAGIWVNLQSITFESVPSYYAIVSTRPLDEVADPLVLRENDIGFEHVRMTPIKGWETGVTTADLQDFKSSVIRLKQKDGLYIQEEYGVAFIGRSLFRASIDLPANVPVGPLDARVYLVREGKLLSTYTARVRLEREGLERVLHAFAFSYPLLYGISTVLMAMAAGLCASAIFKRGEH